MWNISAIDSLQSKQHREALERAEEAVARRKREAVGETQKEIAAAALQTQVDSLKNLKAIERAHRFKMMSLEEESLGLQHQDVSKALEDDHEATMANLANRHDRKMELMKASHASRMAAIGTVRPDPSPAWLGVGDEVVPREFGVATREYLWSIGMPEEYAESHNLARKLETALTCVAAEKPDDPTARLAELLR